MRIRWFIAVAGLCAAVVACDNMANQPKRLPYELPYGAQANWPALPPPHTIARDDRPVPPPPVTLALIERGSSASTSTARRAIAAPATETA